jgi:hypothetical protein
MTMAWASSRRRAYYSPAMEAARPRGRRRRRGRSGAATAMDARLVRVGLLVVAPALAALLLASSSPGPLPRSQLTPLFDGKAALELSEAVSTEFPSRVPGSPGAVGAARWYRETVSALGLPTEEDTWTEDVPDLGRVTLRNVVSVVRGRSQDAIVTVAHRDNAGPGRPDSDNAAGTAALVELARGYAPQDGAPAPQPQHTLVFVSTDGGAYGGAGAARFATTSPLASSVVAAVVLDGLAGKGRPRLAVAGDTPASPPRALVRTAIARVEEQVGTAPALPSLVTQLTDLGMPYAALEQGRLIGHGIAAVTLTTTGHHEPGPLSATPQSGGSSRFENMGKAAEALIDSLDSSVGGTFRTPDALFFADRTLWGWAVRLTLILLVVPVALGAIDLLVRSRRRGLRISAGVRAMRTRLGIWLFGAILLYLGAVAGAFPTGASLPLPAFTSVVSNPPLVAIILLAGTFGLSWLAARRRLVPVRRSSPDERLAGLLVAVLLLCALSLGLVATRPYALVFVLPSLYAWPWIPTERPTWRGVALLLLGLLGPIVGMVALASDVGVTVARVPLYVAGLVTVGYVSVGSVLAAVVWLAVTAQVAAVALGRYAPYANGAEPPPPGAVRHAMARLVGRAR